MRLLIIVIVMIGTVALGGCYSGNKQHYLDARVGEVQAEAADINGRLVVIRYEESLARSTIVEANWKRYQRLSDLVNAENAARYISIDGATLEQVRDGIKLREESLGYVTNDTEVEAYSRSWLQSIATERTRLWLALRSKSDEENQARYAANRHRVNFHGGVTPRKKEEQQQQQEQQ